MKKVYLREKQNLLGIMLAGNPELIRRAKQQVDEGIDFLEKKMKKDLVDPEKGFTFMVN